MIRAASRALAPRIGPGAHAESLADFEPAFALAAIRSCAVFARAVIEALGRVFLTGGSPACSPGSTRGCSCARAVSRHAVVGLRDHARGFRLMYRRSRDRRCLCVAL
jgi:hypothetical protein